MDASAIDPLPVATLFTAAHRMLQCREIQAALAGGAMYGKFHVYRDGYAYRIDITTTPERVAAATALINARRPFFKHIDPSVTIFVDVEDVYVDV